MTTKSSVPLLKPMKNPQWLVWILIFLSTTPFLIAFESIDFFLIQSDPELFWTIFAVEFANISGFIGAMLLFWSTFLGSRFITSLLSPDIAAINEVHKVIGKYGVFFILLHPLLEVYSYGEQYLWLFDINLSTELEQHISAGRIAFILFLIIWITSAAIRGRLKYRPWLYLHYLSYPIMGFVFYHALEIGSTLNSYTWLQALWYTLMVAYAILIITKIIWASGIFKPSYKVIAKQQVGDTITLIRLEPINKKLIPQIGQYVYLQKRGFGESHPFTIMEHDPKTGQLSFGIKSVGPYSKILNELELGSNVNLEGPYGVFTAEAQNEEPKVIIAGGIGITPFIDLVRAYPKKTLLLNCNRKLIDVVYRGELVSLLGKNYYDFVTQEEATNEHIINRRLSKGDIIRLVGENSVNLTHYFVCGSPKFNEGVIDMLNSLGVSPSNIYQEKFSF